MQTRIVSNLPAIILLPLLTWAQTGFAQTPAADAEQAVRARVSEFLQYHVDGNFRKAYDLVAEDTKDVYFNMGKAQLKGFKINTVALTDNSTKAIVVAILSKTMNVMGQDIPVQVPSTTTWKIENGKWVWYDDVKNVSMMPIGIPGNPLAPATPPPAASAKRDDLAEARLPKELNTKIMADSAQSILQQVRVDKKEITLPNDRPSEEQVTLHNGMTGSVQLELSAPEVEGFTAKLEQEIVRSAADVRVIFRYEPPANPRRRDPITVRLTVQPLNQVFVIRVNFAAK